VPGGNEGHVNTYMLEEGAIIINSGWILCLFFGKHLTVRYNNY